ncbi:unnamed protein product [Peniophora sp. CBMAI 1063]|nr:unnamed protein product [Peniophora sp. CBMAI 1063]
MPPTRTQRGHGRRSSGQLSMTALDDEYLPFRYFSDSDSDITSSPSSPTFSSSSASYNFTLPITDDVRNIISCSPAAMKYCRSEVVPAFPLRKTSSHSAKRDSNHIPRPPNAFFLFRSHHAANDPHVEKKNNILSQQAGRIWRSLPSYQKEPFEYAAKIVHERHAIKYPAYKYTPSTERKQKKAASGSKAKKGSKKRRSSKPLVAVTASPSPTPSLDAPFFKLEMPTPTLAMPSPSQLFTFDVSPTQSSVPEAEFVVPEFSFTATNQISPMMLPAPLIDDLTHKFSACKVVEPHEMAADERFLIAPDYTGELPPAMYDAPANMTEFLDTFPPMHEPTINYTNYSSPESTPPPFDPSAPGWGYSFESTADDLFNQFINTDAF